MRLVVHVVIAGLAALAAGAAPPPARGADAITVDRASASAEAIAQIACPGGSRKAEFPGSSSPGGARTLSYNENFVASMDGTKAGCPTATSARASGRANLVASAGAGRLRSRATLTSEIAPTGDATKDASLDGQGIANLSYDLIAEVGATYRIDATLTVSRGDDTSSRGGISFDAGDESFDLVAGGTNPETVTLTRTGTLQPGDEVSLSAFAIAASEPGGLSASRATWSIDLTVTPGGGGEPPAPSGNVTGVVRFEKVPLTARGLNVAKRKPQAAADVLVEVVDGTGNVLRTTTTDGLGRYGFDVTSAAPVRVRVSARMGPFEVRRFGGEDREGDTVRNGDLYFLESEPFVPDAGGPFVKDFLATDDFENGPFNLLHVARKCVNLVRSAEPGVTFPALHFRWHPESTRHTAYSKPEGPRPDEIFVTGLRQRDSDVFDDVVVAHEFGHFVMNRFARSDSPGGPHAAKQSLDPRLAWSEGWATFFGCAATGTPVFRNSGTNGRVTAASTYDIEQNRVRGTPAGITGEFSVASALWDVFDTRSDAGDKLSLGFVPLWDALRSTRNERFVYLGDYFQVIHRSDPSLGTALRSILRTHGVRTATDDGLTLLEPFPAPIASGRIVADLANSILPGAEGGSQGLSTSSRLFEFTLTAPGPVVVELEWTDGGGQPDDLNLFLLDADGASLASSESADPSSVTERIERTAADPLPAGTYVIEVSSTQDPGGLTRVFNRAKFRLKATY